MYKEKNSIIKNLIKLKIVKVKDLGIEKLNNKESIIIDNNIKIKSWYELINDFFIFYDHSYYKIYYIDKEEEKWEEKFKEKIKKEYKYIYY